MTMSTAKKNAQNQEFDASHKQICNIKYRQKTERRVNRPTQISGADVGRLAEREQQVMKERW